MVLASFCGLLTLQVGCTIMSTVFFVVAIYSLGINVFEYRENPENSWPMNLVLVCIFIILMFMACFTMFMAAYNESRKLCLVALCIIALITLYWLILSLFSLLNTPTDVRRVCVEYRCGESFWIASLNYRRTYKKVIEGQHTSTSVEPVVSSDCTVESTISKSTSTTPKTTTTTAATTTTATTTSPKTTTTSATTTTATTTTPKTTTTTTTTTSHKLRHPTTTTTPTSTPTSSPVHIRRIEKRTISLGRGKRLLGGQVRFDQGGIALPSKETSQEMVLLSTVGPVSNELTGKKEKNIFVSLSRRVGNQFKGREDYNSEQLKTHKNIEYEEKNEYVFGAEFAGAISFCIVNLVFLIFTMVLVWSYAKELKRGNYYYYDSTTPLYR